MENGFRRNELQDRYNISSIEEDAWHTYTGEKTSLLLADVFEHAAVASGKLLNAGAGVHSVNLPGAEEFFVDLFLEPIKRRANAICANIEQLPFPNGLFQCVVCVGEVLSYCDPALAIKEFNRVLSPTGQLVCDIGSTRSSRHWFTELFAKRASIVVDEYNGSNENVWRYDPNYIATLLQACGFEIDQKHGLHTWSMIARRFGVSQKTAVTLQAHLEPLKLPIECADIVTFVARKVQ